MATTSTSSSRSSTSSAPAGRRRDGAASRERLLQAASELFAERGYDRATAREISARAGVDTTMIARYFGGKAQLYIAVLHAENGPESTLDLLDPDHLAQVLDRSTHRPPGPIHQVAVRPHEDPAGQAAARAELHRRIVSPLQQHLAGQGFEDSELRGEVIAAAVIGILLARSSGAFDVLPDADNDELRTLLLSLLRRPDEAP
jgi:AcrR family transcriptional regulator